MRLIEVGEIEFDNVTLLNQRLCETLDEPLLLLNRGCISSEEVLRWMEEQKPESSHKIFVWGNFTREAIFSLEDLLCSIELEPYGFFLPAGLLEKTGLLNQRLKGKIHYEFLCRLVREVGSCKVIPAIARRQKTLSKGDFITFAYIIKKNLKFLYDNSCMEKVVQFMSQSAIQQGKFADFQRAMDLFTKKESAYEEIALETAPFIVILGDETCWGVLRDFAERISQELLNIGQAVWKIDHGFYDYEKLQIDICKGVIGFQSSGLEIDFFRRIRGPKFQFWFDHPLHFETALRNLPDDYYVLCQDANHAKIIRDHLHTQNAIQFPPAGTALKKEWEEVNRDRPYDLVFVGSYSTDDISGLSVQETDFYHFMVANPRLTFEEGFYTMYGQDKKDFVEERYSLKKACRTVIAHFRKRVIDVILAAGYDIHVYGDSWDAYEGNGSGRLIRHPSVSPQESLVEWSKAKIGINVMSWHKAGMTERVANILLSGAVCLSEDTEYLRKHFQDGENILTFSLDQLEEIPNKIAMVLGNDDFRLQISKNAYEKAMKEHTWRVRAEELLELIRGNSQPKLEIYVATHVKFDPPENPIYVPLHVGRKGKKDLGYLGDNTGNHISDLNDLYGELTGLFWIWQNVEEVDYVGFCHYQRYFLNSSGMVMQRKEYLDLLEKFDAIIPKHGECDCPYYEHCGKTHNGRVLDAVERALDKLYPEYRETFQRIMAGNIYYSGNLMVTSLSIIKAYAEWLFQIFLEASEEMDVSSYDAYHGPAYGFLSEQMFYVFLEANGLSYCEVQIGIKTNHYRLEEEIKC